MYMYICFNLPAEGADNRDPTKVHDERWIVCDGPANLSHLPSFGKWMVFYDYDDLYKSWRNIQQRVLSGQLGATAARCSTMLKDETSSCHSGGVIEVFTTKEDMDKVGMKLIFVDVVRHGIKYKTNEATEKGLYRAKGEEKTAYRVLRWNDGKPCFYKK